MNLDRVRELLDAARGKRVAVVGDLMLDRYIWGDASRISQEAPVPIVQVKRISASPGGAANVLRNLATLGAQPVAFGTVGTDNHGAELVQLLKDQNIDTVGVVEDSARITTEKTRIIAGNQQVVRVDTEDTRVVEPAVVHKIKHILEGEANDGNLDAIIVEDYAKGLVNREVLEAVVDIGRRHNLLVAQDPHPGNAAYAKGMTVLTPNRTEAFMMAGAYKPPAVYPIHEDAALLDVVKRLQQRFEPKYLLVTLGKGGMALFNNGNHALHIPTQAREVFDVSGAGDTVIASFVLAMVAGATPEEAAIVSNHAAGVVVGKVGTAPVYPEEVLAAFELEAK